MNGVKLFGGWYSDSGLTQAYNFNTPVTSDITLYAKWIDPSVTITSSHGNDSIKKGQLFEYVMSYTPSDASVTISGADWLSADRNTIYGTPTSVGTYNVTLTVSASGYASATQSFTITVSSVLTPVNSPSNGAIAYVR